MIQGISVWSQFLKKNSDHSANVCPNQLPRKLNSFLFFPPFYCSHIPFSQLIQNNCENLVFIGSFKNSLSMLFRTLSLKKKKIATYKFEVPKVIFHLKFILRILVLSSDTKTINFIIQDQTMTMMCIILLVISQCL